MYSCWDMNLSLSYTFNMYQLYMYTTILVTYFFCRNVGGTLLGMRRVFDVNMPISNIVLETF